MSTKPSELSHLRIKCAKILDVVSTMFNVMTLVLQLLVTTIHNRFTQIFSHEVITCTESCEMINMYNFGTLMTVASQERESHEVISDLPIGNERHGPLILSLQFRPSSISAIPTTHLLRTISVLRVFALSVHFHFGL